MPELFYILIWFALACSPAQAERSHQESMNENRLSASAIEVVRRGRGAEAPASPASPNTGSGESKGAANSDTSKGEAENADDKKSAEDKAKAEAAKAETAKVEELKAKEGTPTKDDVKDLNKFIDELSKAPKDEFTDQRNQQIKELIDLRSSWFNLQSNEIAKMPPPGNTPAEPPANPASVAGNPTIPTPQSTQAQAIGIVSLTPPAAPAPPPVPPAPPPSQTAPTNVASQAHEIFSAPPAPLAPISKPVPPPANEAGPNSASASNGSSGQETLPIFRSSTSGANASPVFSTTLPALPPSFPAPPPALAPPPAPAAPSEPSTPIMASAPPSTLAPTLAPPLAPPPAPEPMQPSLPVSMGAAAAPPPSPPPALQAKTEARPIEPVPSNAQTSFSPMPTEPMDRNSIPATRGNSSYADSDSVGSLDAEPIAAPEPDPLTSSKARIATSFVTESYNPPRDSEPGSSSTASAISLVDIGPTQEAYLPSLAISASPTKTPESATAVPNTDLRAFGEMVAQATNGKEKQVQEKRNDLTGFRYSIPARR